MEKERERHDWQRFVLHYKHSGLWKCNARFAQINKWLLIFWTYVDFLMYLSLLVFCHWSLFKMGSMQIEDSFTQTVVLKWKFWKFLFYSLWPNHFFLTFFQTALCPFQLNALPPHQRHSDVPYSGLLKSYSVSSSFHHRSPHLQVDGVVRAERSKHPTTFIKTADTEWKCSAQKIFCSRDWGMPRVPRYLCISKCYAELKGIWQFSTSASLTFWVWDVTATVDFLLQCTACGQQLKAIGDICLGKRAGQ